MIQEIKSTVERMRQKLMEIEDLTVTAQVDGSHTGLQASKYRIYGQALAKIAEIVKPNAESK